VKRRMLMTVLSVILALVVAVPLASAQTVATTPTNQTKLGALTASWWNWAMQDPSPLQGSYTGGPKCDGNFVHGVFFLAGAASVNGAPSSVERTCTVRANKPILFPVTNVICSKAFGVAGQDPPDPKPYDTACATPTTADVINPPSRFYARVDGNGARQRRIASGIFQWTIASNDNPYGLIAGTYPAASDGLWVYLQNGLQEGNHTVKFGGRYEITPFGTFEGTKVTYNLRARQ
jgi:hypothetical protein